MRGRVVEEWWEAVRTALGWASVLAHSLHVVLRHATTTTAKQGVKSWRCRWSDALLHVCRQFGVDDASLESYRPRTYTESIDGRTAADLGGEPILHMRAFQKEAQLPEALVSDIRGRGDDGLRA